MALPPACAIRVSAATTALCAVLLAGVAQALPIDFSDKLENALLCRSEWGNAFWQDYLNKALNKSVRDWGEARWWTAQGANVGGVTAVEVFTNIGDDRVLMIGALIGQPVDQVKSTIEKQMHVTFKPVQAADGTRYVTDTLSVLAPTTDGQTKWYCAKWNLGNRP
jgi:hypothetical protein